MSYCCAATLLRKTPVVRIVVRLNLACRTRAFARVVHMGYNTLSSDVDVTVLGTGEVIVLFTGVIRVAGQRLVDS